MTTECDAVLESMDHDARKRTDQLPIGDDEIVLIGDVRYSVMLIRRVMDSRREWAELCLKEGTQVPGVLDACTKAVQVGDSVAATLLKWSRGDVTVAVSNLSNTWMLLKEIWMAEAGQI